MNAQFKDILYLNKESKYVFNLDIGIDNIIDCLFSSMGIEDYFQVKFMSSDSLSLFNIYFSMIDVFEPSKETKRTCYAIFHPKPGYNLTYPLLSAYDIMVMHSHSSMLNYNTHMNLYTNVGLDEDTKRMKYTNLSTYTMPDCLINNNEPIEIIPRALYKNS